MYSDKEGAMTRETCSDFISGCTGDKCSADDGRITGLFSLYDKNKDGRIEREDFLEFYRGSAKNKPEIVRQNVIAHGYRNDLKKVSEIKDANIRDIKTLPRFTISHSKEYQEILYSLLDNN